MLALIKQLFSKPKKTIKLDVKWSDFKIRYHDDAIDKSFERCSPDSFWMIYKGEVIPGTHFVDKES